MAQTLSTYAEGVSSLDVDAHYIYTSSTRGEGAIDVWDKDNKKHVRGLEGLRKGTRLCVDEYYIYTTSLYHFMVIDRQTLKPVHEAQFGRDISSDLGRPMNDDAHVYFPIRNGRLVIVDKQDFTCVKTVLKHKAAYGGLTLTTGVSTRVRSTIRSKSGTSKPSTSFRRSPVTARMCSKFA
jgi:hypothetical protein